MVVMAAERGDRLDDLETAGLLLLLGDRRTDQLPYIAAEALASGFDSPWLRRAAGAAPDDADNASQWFLWALEELGCDCDVEEEEACCRLIRDIARRVVDDDLAPSAGAHRIWQLSCRVRDEGDLRIFVGLASELQDHPDQWPALDRQIHREAAALLARSKPRTWVLPKADAGIASPLWQPVPRRVLDPDALELSDSLRADLARWLETFAENVERAVTQRGQRSWGRSVFGGRDEAVAFVQRGQELATCLQDELGADYVVEYYPEPVDPIGGFRS